jgi:hypothetical protein
LPRLNEHQELLVRETTYSDHRRACAETHSHITKARNEGTEVSARIVASLSRQVQSPDGRAQVNRQNLLGIPVLIPSSLGFGISPPAIIAEYSEG